MIPDCWDDLVGVLSNEWSRCTAWAVGGGDPDGLEIRIFGGRAVYDAAWCVLGKDRDRVRLARIDGREGLREVCRYVDPGCVVEVRRQH